MPLAADVAGDAARPNPFARSAAEPDRTSNDERYGTESGDRRTTAGGRYSRRRERGNADNRSFRASRTRPHSSDSLCRASRLRPRFRDGTGQRPSNRRDRPTSTSPRTEHSESRTNEPRRTRYAAMPTTGDDRQPPSGRAVNRVAATGQPTKNLPSREKPRADRAEHPPIRDPPTIRGRSRRRRRARAGPAIRS